MLAEWHWIHFESTAEKNKIHLSLISTLGDPWGEHRKTWHWSANRLPLKTALTEIASSLQDHQNANIKSTIRKVPSGALTTDGYMTYWRSRHFTDLLHPKEKLISHVGEFWWYWCICLRKLRSQVADLKLLSLCENLQGFILLIHVVQILNLEWKQA